MIGGGLWLPVAVFKGGVSPLRFGVPYSLRAKQTHPASVAPATCPGLVRCSGATAALPGFLGHANQSATTKKGSLHTYIPLQGKR